MRVLLLLLVALSLAAPRLASAQAVIDTTRGRYYQPIFSTVTVTSNVPYGSAVTYDGNTQQLLMDIYQPANDTVKRRPVIIFAHQGGFILGSRTDAYMVSICTRMAKLGYVTASIEYRLGIGATALFFGDTVALAKAAFRGMQDMRAAVRFFRNNAATTKTYRTNPNYIVVGGSSAGGFAALETGYLDKLSEVPAYIGQAALGGIEGTGGNPGYSSVPTAVLSLSGATETPQLIEPGNAPLFCAHGTADATAPYLQGKVGSFLPPKYVYGGGRLVPRAQAIGVRSTLLRFSKAGHIPFESSAAYADTTFWGIRDFLRPILRLSSPLATRSSTAAPLIQAYPNPAQEVMQLQLPDTWAQLGELELLDATGRVVRRVQPQAQHLQVERQGLAPGMYLLRFTGQPPVRVAWE